MKILLAALSGPAVQPTLGLFATRIEQALRSSDHEVDVFYLPAAQSADSLLQHAYAARFLDFGSGADRLLTIGTACHVLAHPAKICLLPARDQSLDLLDPATDSPEQRYVRVALATAFSQSRRVLVDSEGRLALDRFLGGAESFMELPSWEPEHLERGLR